MKEERKEGIKGVEGRKEGRNKRKVVEGRTEAEERKEGRKVVEERKEGS